MNNSRVLLLHVLLGVPLAAVFESLVQFASSGSPAAGEVPVFFFSVVLVVVVGSVVLLPAFALQAVIVILLAKWNVARGWLVATGAVLQASLVLLFAVFVGLEPSLAGRFPVTPPMMAAGALAGALVAWISTARVRAAAAPV